MLTILLALSVIYLKVYPYTKDIGYLKLSVPSDERVNYTVTNIIIKIAFTTLFGKL